MKNLDFTSEEKNDLIITYKHVLEASRNFLSKEDIRNVKKLMFEAAQSGKMERESNTIHPIIKDLHTVLILLNEMSLGRTAAMSVLLYRAVSLGVLSIKETEKKYGKSIAIIIKGLIRVTELYEKNASIETENFRKLLLTFAEDLRVILIMIAERYYIMQILKCYPKEEQITIAREVSYLYAPLAHRLGLYNIKTVLEDLSLKFTNREIYSEIARKLNETKRSRDAYIKQFITPLKEKLDKTGFDFEIKGRTKSIYSIYNKIKKQNTPFENIYDLFAIRVILNSPPEKEKSECWQVYSIVADMYQPNPKRLRDWLSIPKSNGYESLHTTVMGPLGKWVEVQIRTRRMDEVAEKGLAAHWKYKGVSSEQAMDEWLKGIRDILENPELNAVDFMDNFKLNLYDKEVFVFTPNGDLHKLPKGSTVLDFAFSIHTGLGGKCVGAIVNGKNVPMKHKLNNGDQVEVLTSPTQSPKQDWLNIVVTSRAKTKIKQALKEVLNKDAEIGKEFFRRRFKNWKIEIDDAKIMHITKKFNFKTVTDFYVAIAQETLDILDVRDAYLELDKHSTEQETISAENFIHTAPLADISTKEDVMIIERNLKDIEYKLAKCCNPIYGDDVFGFVTSSGGIKIHRADCPNAPQMISRFGYRIVKAQWSGKAGSQYTITIRVVGNDDVGIVANITSVISKEKNIVLRSISIDSHDGLFQGNLTVLISELNDLQGLIKKIKTIKGVKYVERA
ncbi:RelA/SpoT family protein [Bacteroidales bacterium OttesenSCG-928-I21]|nr:RelA/SpoT family protein [Bacteroidales bacterium OttesenSCG-928-I21]